MTAVPDKIYRDLNRSGATQVEALDITKAFNKVLQAGLLHKLRPFGISSWIFGIILSFFRNGWLGVIQDEKSGQDFMVNVRVLQGFTLGPTFSLLYINDLSDDFICNDGTYADDTALYSKCDQASDFW